MEIIGQLVRLTDEVKLPIPWYSRGHLGLESGSSASVGFTCPGDRLIPDIIVAPYDLQNLDRMFFLSITGKDEAGFISNVQEQFRSHNIILSESVTTEGRNNHRINIAFEIDNRASNGKEAFSEFYKLLKAHFGDDATRIIEPPFELQEGFHHIYDHSVLDGQITLNDWQSTLKEIASNSKENTSEYDFSKLVISSNTECRFIRYIVPRNETFEIRIPHRNKPGSAHAITKQLAGLGLNVLSHRISRTQPPNASSDVSTLVLICEPESSVDASKVKAELREKLFEPEIQKSAGLHRPTISSGVPSVKALYVLPRKFRGIRIPRDLERAAAIFEQELDKQGLPRNSKRIFISHKFHGSPDKKAIVTALKKAINDAGCVWLEAPVDPGQPRTYEPIHARLWMADAAVIIALDKKEGGVFSINQTHEIGFMQGQRKPIRVIVSEDNLGDAKGLSNVPDSTMFTYGKISELTNEDDLQSLRKKIAAWVNSNTELEWDWLNQI